MSTVTAGETAGSWAKSPEEGPRSQLPSGALNAVAPRFGPSSVRILQRDSQR